jgi:hypothetical protein
MQTGLRGMGRKNVNESHQRNGFLLPGSFSYAPVLYACYGRVRGYMALLYFIVR